MFSKRYQRWVLSALTLAYTLSTLDQVLLSVLLQPIKLDLQLTDTQLGFLTGIAFGLLYAILGLPIARWTDRGNRVTIMSIAMCLWGITVASCLFASTFTQLVVARVFASVGAAGCMAPTYSLLADYFPLAAERTRAMAIYMLAGPIGPLVSYAFGGWLNVHYGWRWSFFVIGIPGVITALLLRATIREPRAAGVHAGSAERSMPSAAHVLSTMWQQRASRHLSVAIIIFFTIGLGVSPWVAAFLIRSHHMTTEDLGVWLGLILGLGGVCGVLFGGYVSEHWLGNDEQKQMRVCSMLIASLAPCYAVLLLSPNVHLALFALTLLVIAGNFVLGPTFALLQRLISDETRATALAIVMLLANLIGMGVGPQVVGVLSDLLRPKMGTDSLRYGMLAVALLAPWSAYHFWQAGRFVKRGLPSTPLAMAPAFLGEGGV